MKGDFTRDSFRPERHYSAVLQQQGRVQLDADWNEALDIIAHFERTALQDVIGRCCVPKDSDGFLITATGASLQIGAGHCYVDGILCQNERSRLFDDQSDAPSAALPAQPGRYIAYLDVWERHITALEDQELREVALGGPDTATRRQVLAQVKLQRTAAATTCADLGDEWRPDNSQSTGTLAARARPTAIVSDPCIIPPSAGYRRLENQLYRVEIHRSGPLGTATFLFSRENGAVVSPWLDQDGAKIIVADEGRDANLAFQSGGWVELTDDTRELDNRPGILAQVQVEGRELTVTAVADPDDPAATTVDINAFDSGRKVRRWDSAGALPATIAAGNDGFLPLEDGVEIRFGPNNAEFRSGDYWLIPARTALGDLLWPLDSGNNARALPRHGIAHHYCPLAIVDRGPTSWQVAEDCRCLFPPLSNIDADDVGFDNSNCLPDLAAATNVQQALEILCQTDGGHCTFNVTPASDLQAIFDAIAPGGDAQVCFAVGDYQISQTVIADGKGTLLLSGSGAGTRVTVSGAETALRFNKCAGVTVEKMALISANEKLVRGDSLNGVLSFIDCGDVTVDAVTVRCSGAASRAASCIRVHTREQRQATVRIHHCTLAVGQLQSGILLTNVWRSSVVDNVIRAAGLVQNVTIARLAQDAAFRARLRRMLVGNLQINADERAAGRALVSFTVGRQRIQFESDPALADAKLWQTLLRQEGGDLTDIGVALRRAADRVLLGSASLAPFPELRAWRDRLEKDNIAASGQGVVIGGVHASDVRILDNTIEDTLQGIHVGLSHTEAQRGAPDSALTVLIRGNTVNVILSAGATQERHAIFVGNCNSVVVDDNMLTLRRLPTSARLRVEAIRIFGHLGKRMIVRHNHTADFNIGVRANPLNAVGNPKQPQWLIADNVASVSVTNDNTNVPIADQLARVRQSQNFA